MRAAATKKMAAVLNKAAAARGKKYTFILEAFTVDQYRALVSDPFTADLYGDYDYKTGYCKAIRCTYPAEWYAPPRFITTQSLEALASVNKNINYIIKHVFNYCDC